MNKANMALRSGDTLAIGFERYQVMGTQRIRKTQWFILNGMDGKTAIDNASLTQMLVEGRATITR